MRPALALICALLGTPALADTPALLLDLNAAEDAGGACRLTFVAENRLGADLAELGVEAVVFTPLGRVERLMLLDFQSLPQGRPRVRQFDLPGLACADVGQVLVNAVAPCKAEGLAPGLCETALVLTSRVDSIGVAG